MAGGGPAGPTAPPAQAHRLDHLRPATTPQGRAGRRMGIDFHFARVEGGQALKVCSIVDEHARESLGGLTGTSTTGERVIDPADQIAAVRAYPLMLRADMAHSPTAKRSPTGPRAGLDRRSSRGAPRGTTAASSHSTPASATSA